uniref:Uncharacterized protein n=1 Tax=Arundo donax TaxID=35708 RepID=A0A0A8YH50_ARUDO
MQVQTAEIVHKFERLLELHELLHGIMV